MSNIKYGINFNSNSNSSVSQRKKQNVDFQGIDRRRLTSSKSDEVIFSGTQKGVNKKGLAIGALGVLGTIATVALTKGKKLHPVKLAQQSADVVNSGTTPKPEG